MDKADVALVKYTFMYRLGGKVKNSEFYKLQPYANEVAGLLVVQDLYMSDMDGKRVWRAVMFWPSSGAQILFDEQIHAPASDNADRVAASALGFFTLREGDTDSEYFDNYTDAQKAFRDEHAEHVGALAYNPKNGQYDSGESLAHLRIP